MKVQKAEEGKAVTIITSEAKKNTVYRHCFNEGDKATLIEQIDKRVWQVKVGNVQQVLRRDEFIVHSVK